MSLTTLKNVRDYVSSMVRETQVGSLVDSNINLILMEMHTVSNWTWLRRKTTFSTVADQESYNLDEEVDRVAFLRERTSPRKFLFVPDPAFYAAIPNPEDVGSGTPIYYRLWEETGFRAQPAAAEKVTVVSSSAADTSTFTVRIVGRESTNNLQVAETITLNGTTAVASTSTYAIDGLLSLSKSAATTGTITVAGQTSATTMGLMAPLDLSPRQKRLSFSPPPSSVVTVYLEYYERLRPLTADSDVPQMDHRWNWVLIAGVLSKMWVYKQNEVAGAQAYALYRDGLRQIEAEDQANADYIPVLRRRIVSVPTIYRVTDSVNNNYPGYALNY